MKEFASVKNYDCVSAFFAVKELVAQTIIITVMIKEAVCE